jgi:hypothetical protein
MGYLSLHSTTLRHHRISGKSKEYSAGKIEKSERNAVEFLEALTEIDQSILRWLGVNRALILVSRE